MPTPIPPIKLYWTDALPMHYVAADEAGEKWLIPVAPMGPDVWEQAKPYKGDHALARVRPTAIERCYQPDSDDREVTVSGAAEVARCARSTIHRAAQSGDLPVSRMVGTRRIFRVGDVKDWMKRGLSPRKEAETDAEH